VPQSEKISNSIPSALRKSLDMTDTSELTNFPPAQELAEVISELEQYRERLLTETLENAKKAKMQKSAVMAQLEPELAKIDDMLKSLTEQQATLDASN
jgi:flagellar motor switch protein FliG